LAANANDFGVHCAFEAREGANAVNELFVMNPPLKFSSSDTHIDFCQA